MPIEVEYHGLTGTVSGPLDGLIPLATYPTTGPEGTYDIAVNVMGGNTLRLGVDFGLTGVNNDILTYNLESSSIKVVRQKDIDLYGSGSTGIELRVAYNRE